MLSELVLEVFQQKLVMDLGFSLSVPLSANTEQVGDGEGARETLAPLQSS